MPLQALMRLSGLFDQATDTTPTVKELENDFALKVKDVSEALQTGAQDKDLAGDVLMDLQAMAESSPTKFVETVLAVHDDIKSGELEETDPRFNAAGATAQGYADFFSGGYSTPIEAAAKTVGDLGEISSLSDLQKKFRGNLKETRETKRLLKQQYPVSSFAGATAAAVTPVGMGKFLNTAAKVGLKNLDDIAARLVARAGGKSAFAGKMVDALTQNFVAKSVAATIPAVAAYKGVEAASKQTGELFAGTTTMPQAITEIAKETAHGAFVEGPLYGAAFGLAATPVLGIFKGGKWVANKAAEKYAKSKFGKDLRFQMDNVELMQDIAQTAPETIIATEAKKLAPVVRQTQERLVTIQRNAKDSILRGLRNDKLALGAELDTQAIKVNRAVEGLKNSERGNIAGAARQLYKEVGNTRRAVNRQYGEMLDAVIAKEPTKLVDMAPVVEHLGGQLRKFGALNPKGQLVPNSAWAEANPDAFKVMSQIWHSLGGSKVNPSASAATLSKLGNFKMNIRDAIELNKSIGELANFSKGRTAPVTPFERLMREGYHVVAKQNQGAFPGLKKANAFYATNRSKIDKFVSLVGKTEEQVKNSLSKDLANNKNLFVREAVEGFAAMGDDIKIPVSSALGAQERLQVISQFAKSPRQAVNQIKAAYLSNDTITLRMLDDVVDKFPQLRPFLNTAKKQADDLMELAALEEATPQAFRGDEFAQSQIAESIPEARAALNTAAQARGQAEALKRALPSDQARLETTLRSQKFAQTGAEQEAIAALQAETPQTAAPLRRAEGVRVQDRVSTGAGLEKSAFEGLPLIGDVIFSLRKMATPAASAILKMVGTAPAKLRKPLILELFNYANGSNAVSKAALLKLQQEIGAEAALMLYAQNGGAEDLLMAAERMGREMAVDN